LIRITKNTRDLNVSESGGWSTYYYGVFSKVIEENHYKRVAELGVGYGTHSRYILEHNKDIEHLTIIDPMKWYPNDTFAEDIANCVPVEGKNNFDRLHELIHQDLSRISNKYTWIRKESNDVTTEDIPDQSLDAIFVDGDHSYTAVINDLRKYWNKVRSGGQLLGDDYWMADVSRAVHEFSENVGVPFDFLYRPGSDYKIYRFIKP
jgi:hypothetical protein